MAKGYVAENFEAKKCINARINEEIGRYAKIPKIETATTALVSEQLDKTDLVNDSTAKDITSIFMDTSEQSIGSGDVSVLRPEIVDTKIDSLPPNLSAPALSISNFKIVFATPKVVPPPSINNELGNIEVSFLYSSFSMIYIYKHIFNLQRTKTCEFLNMMQDISPMIQNTFSPTHFETASNILQTSEKLYTNLVPVLKIIRIE